MGAVRVRRDGGRRLGDGAVREPAVRGVAARDVRGRGRGGGGATELRVLLRAVRRERARERAGAAGEAFPDDARGGERTQKTNPPPKKTNDPSPRAGPRGVEPETLTIGLAGEDNRGASRGRPRGGRPVPPRGVLAERARPAVRGDARARAEFARARSPPRSWEPPAAPGPGPPPPPGGQSQSLLRAGWASRTSRGETRRARRWRALFTSPWPRATWASRSDPRRDGASVPGAGRQDPWPKAAGGATLAHSASDNARGDPRAVWLALEAEGEPPRAGDEACAAAAADASRAAAAEAEEERAALAIGSAGPSRVRVGRAACGRSAGASSWTRRSRRGGRSGITPAPALTPPAFRPRGVSARRRERGETSPATTRRRATPRTPPPPRTTPPRPLSGTTRRSRR